MQILVSLINRTEFVEQSVTPMKVVDGKDALDPTLSRMYSTAKTELVSYCMGSKQFAIVPLAETRPGSGSALQTLWHGICNSDSLAAMYATMLNVPFYFQNPANRTERIK
jgi:hypothetical protein